MHGPADTILLSEAMRQDMDGSLYWWGGQGQVDFPWHPNSGSAGPVDPVRPRPGLYNWATWRTSHRGNANAVYFDLHVAAVGWTASNPSHDSGGPGNQWSSLP